MLKPKNSPTGTLYLMPNTLDFGVTALADLQDALPLGPIRIASTLTHWVAENAKTTRAFLKRVDAVVPLQNPLQDIHITTLPRPPKDGSPTNPDLTTLLAPLLAGQHMGLISEAGLPAVADPGAALVHSAHQQGLRVTALPGPSSLLLALAASGLQGQNFAFVGYLPIAAPARSARIKALESLSQQHAQTQLMIETPYRNSALLSALIANLKPNTWLSVSVGLTLANAWSQTERVSHWRKSPPSIPNDIPSVFALLQDD